MNNVQKLRRLYKKTQNDISDLIDYPKPLYAAFENGQIPMPEEKITLLCNYYNVTNEYPLKNSAFDTTST